LLNQHQAWPGSYKATFAACALVMGAFYLWCAQASNEPFEWHYDNGGFYNHLGRAFSAGHLYLPLQPSPELLALPDPWDPQRNAGLGTLDTYADEGLLTRGASMAPVFEESVHSLKGLPNVIDVRNIGLVAGIELAPIAGEPGKRAFQVFLDCWEKGVLVRTTGDTVALSPPLIIEPQHIDQIVNTLRDAIKRAA